MLRSLRRRHRAMATLFEAILVGEDEEHLDAAASAVFEEIDRVERLLSRFDPASEVSRVNREAAERPVRVDVELFEILRTCEAVRLQTAGYFDVTSTRVAVTAGRIQVPDATASQLPVPSAGEKNTGSGLPEASESDAVGSELNANRALQLDAASRTVRLPPDAQLNFGAFGKGYALDRAGELLRRYGIRSALLHGGTSSVLTLGCDGVGRAWRVGVRDPFDATGARDAEIAQLALNDMAMSTSAVLDVEREVSDIVDPTTGQPLKQQAACVVLTPTAAEAEIFSTALLAMGRDRAADYTCRANRRDWHIAWIDAPAGTPTFTWFTEPLP